MEFRQLEYFLVACEKGSFNRAAECLYTSQPNVSKVISALEQELGRSLFERTSRGLKITPYGETVREYAQAILKNVSVINSMADRNSGKKFLLATYPSNMVAGLLADFYKTWSGRGYVVEHQEGSVEEVSDWVASGISEVGIVYIAEKQIKSFQHILGHKRLVFEPMDVKEACVYVGPNSPWYHEDSIGFDELPNVKFIRGVRDYFSMDHHLEQVSLGAVSTQQLRYAMYSNSDHVTIRLLTSTDLCSLGINFLYPQYEQYPIKALRIRDCEPFLVIGYIKLEHQNLSEAAVWFIEEFKKML
ncbi:MAG: LysR family transcriptional regulator [Eubacteriales bacterium]|nr:LysR family transcriptional regulator [Eubacteriales bacterium]